MPIRVEQPGLAGLYGAAAVVSKAEKEAQRKQDIQMQQQYQQDMKVLDAQLDLEMYERSKRWEIDKMQLRSQVDFQREEQQRQRKLDSIDSAIQQIDKEVSAGRMTEQEAYPLKLKYEMEKMGVDMPTSLLPGREEEGYGVRPYWMRGRDAPEGTPERQLYESKMAEGISGERMGTRPYYFDPSFLSTYPEAARQAQEARGVFLSDEEFNAMARGETAELPLGDKQLDVGVQTQPIEAVGGERVRVISPNGEAGSILRGEITEYRAAGFEIIDEPTKEVEPAGVREQLEAGRAKLYKPSLGTFATMSPLRYLMERRKAKKLVR